VSSDGDRVCSPMEPRWEAMLRGEHQLAHAHRIGRRAFGLLPSPWRCKFCNAPFKGPVAGIVRWIGYTPSRKNPSICARCIEHAPEGGAIVPLTVLFADVRGYTALSERLSPAEVPTMVMRFYSAASKALLAHGGLLAQIAGDEVMALFVPGLAGDEYPTRAVAGAQSLLEEIGYGSREGNWLNVGVGVATGEEYVGNVTNTAARLTATAAAGEILVDASTFEQLGSSFDGSGRRELQLKGKSAPVAAYSIAVGRA
jgi:class 3 adenylate cyclase